MSADRILSEAEMSAVHGGVFGKQLATSYRDIFVRYVEDIGKNLSTDKLHALLGQDFSFRNHVKP